LSDFKKALDHIQTVFCRAQPTFFLDRGRVKVTQASVGSR
jgi:hypothetical protein